MMTTWEWNWPEKQPQKTRAKTTMEVVTTRITLTNLSTKTRTATTTVSSKTVTVTTTTTWTTTKATVQECLWWIEKSVKLSGLLLWERSNWHNVTWDSWKNILFGIFFLYEIFLWVRKGTFFSSHEWINRQTRSRKRKKCEETFRR